MYMYVHAYACIYICNAAHNRFRQGPIGARRGPENATAGGLGF